MVNTKKNKTLRLSAGSALRALALLGAGVTAGAFVATPAMAQDYTSAGISGSVVDAEGNPVAGAEVIIDSVETGVSRTVTTSSGGRFRANGLPAGTLNITVKAAGQSDYRAEGLRVLPSQTASLNVVMSANDEIVVRGERLAEVAAFDGTTTGLNVDVAELVKTVPVGRSLTAVTLLAPGTGGGDAAFGSLVSIGGSSVAENAYYVNGLNTTNFDNYLGSAQVPFEFYQTVETKTGGYSAEYGRATGGISNATTKSGSNDFMAALHVNWSPDFLQSSGKDLQNCEYAGGTVTWVQAETDTLICDRATLRYADEASSLSTVVEAGGPIIKDRLFIYGLLEMRNSTSITHAKTAGSAAFRKSTDPFWGVKVDAYPIDSQHLEFTVFDTRTTTFRTDKSFTVGADGAIAYGSGPSSEFNFGGLNFVGKWTGNMTDWLTVSAAYGRMRDRFDNTSDSAGLVYSRNLSGATLNGVANGGFFTSQRTTTIQDPYNTEREFYRGDVDLFVSLLGEHHIRGGFDVENNTLSHFSVRTGNADLCASGFLNSAACDAGQGGAGAVFLYRPGGQVEINYYNSGGDFQATNQAFYIQDEWKIGNRLTLSLGLRRDDFKVEKADGSTLVNLKENYAPRIGLTYKLWPDESGTFKAFYGQYYLPVASNTAYRQASAEYFFRERWNYSGISAGGIPTLTTQVTTDGTYVDPCPFGLTPGSSGQNCNVTGDGTVPDTSAAIAANLKATKQSEFIVGYEHRFGEWTVGINYVRRQLDITAEDAAIDAAVLAYCADNGLVGCENTWTGFNQYVILNPGQDLTVNLRGQDGRQVTFTAAELGYPKAERTYDAVELTFNRPFQDGWALGGSYTWSQSKGNSEGYVQSDFGQDDAGITQDFDQPGFGDGAYGFTPNHRTHRLKLFGAVALSDYLTIGGNYSLQSPRRLSCFGYHPTDAFANGYDAASHYCNGQLSVRGEGLKTDWISQFDLSVRVNLEMPGGQAVTLRADVFNLLNSRSVEKRGEFGDISVDYGSDGLPDTYYRDPSYGIASEYQAPRSVRLGVDVQF